MYMYNVIYYFFVRILKLDKDSYRSRSSSMHNKGVPTGKLSLVNVSKPHTQAVTAIAIDPEGKLLATGVSSTPLLSYCNNYLSSINYYSQKIRQFSL